MEYFHQFLFEGFPNSTGTSCNEHEQVKDHFIFTVESVGALAPGVLVGMVRIPP